MVKKNPANKKTLAKRQPVQAKPKPKADPWGCMAGTVTFLPDVDLTAPGEETWNATTQAKRTERA
jgi:hypothetical protein